MSLALPAMILAGIGSANAQRKNTTSHDVRRAEIPAYDPASEQPNIPDAISNNSGKIKNAANKTADAVSDAYDKTADTVSDAYDKAGRKSTAPWATDTMTAADGMPIKKDTAKKPWVVIKTVK